MQKGKPHLVKLGATLFDKFHKKVFETEEDYTPIIWMGKEIASMKRLMTCVQKSRACKKTAPIPVSDQMPEQVILDLEGFFYAAAKTNGGFYLKSFTPSFLLSQYNNIITAYQYERKHGTNKSRGQGVNKGLLEKVESYWSSHRRTA